VSLYGLPWGLTGLADVGPAYNPWAIIGGASNVRLGSNPAYTTQDFYQSPWGAQFYVIVPDIIVQQFLNMANCSVLQCRWHELWEMGMALFIAHFCTNYLEVLACAQPPPIPGPAGEMDFSNPDNSQYIPEL
jgi:hypothetical protein